MMPHSRELFLCIGGCFLWVISRALLLRAYSKESRPLILGSCHIQRGSLEVGSFHTASMTAPTNAYGSCIGNGPTVIKPPVVVGDSSLLHNCVKALYSKALGSSWDVPKKEILTEIYSRVS